MGWGVKFSGTYRLDGVVKSRYEQDWSGAGQLLSKRWYRNGEAEPTRSESFTYERLRNELQKWSVQAVEGYAIEDASGRAIKTQSYSYDALGNVRTCVTTYEEGQVETRNYQYDDTMQPTRRTAVLGDDLKAVISLEVDANGSLTKNAHGQTLSYSHDGQLISVEQGGLLMSRYEYDEQGRLATQWDEAQKQFRVLEYEEDRLCGERWLDAKGTPVRHKILDEETGLVVHCTDVGKERDVTKTFFLLSDPQAAGGEQFSIDEHGEWESQAIGFTPWGEAPLQRLNAMASGMGYNAQRVDPVTGFYHLGNGYRVYDPHHQAFYQSDSLSPFGEGGLNDRAYCAGHDPINWHDPSGHIMISRREQNENLASLDEMIRDTTPPYHEPVPWWEYAILGGVFILSVAASVMTGGAAGALILAVAAASTALGAAALAIQHTNPKLSEKLNLAATLVGLADLAVNLGTALAKGAVKWAKAAWTASRSVRNAVKLGSVKLLKHVTSGVKAFRGSGTRLLERTAADIASPSRIERSTGDVGR